MIDERKGRHVISIMHKIQDIRMMLLAYRIALQKKVTVPISLANEKLLVVATGPSSNIFWQSEEYRIGWANKKYDLCLVNDAFFKYKDIVFQIRPKFYCIMDSYYFDKKGVTSDEIERLIYAKKNRKILNAVDWDLTLIVPCGVSIDWLQNSKIKIIYINCLVNNREDFRFKFFFYKRNWMNPGWNNVVQAALYFAITFEYKQVAMLGAEFNFWKNVYLNEDGHVIQEIEHCYEAHKVERVFDIEEDYGGHREGTMSLYLSRVAETFSFYSFLREYADIMGTHIMNYSQDTMIEAFERVQSLGVDDVEKKSNK